MKSPLLLRWQGREPPPGGSALSRGYGALVRSSAVKTNVYVDGFNLYYGAVKNTPYKWLNIRRMCELAFPKNEIAEIHYCTAIVTDAPWDPHQSTRQQMLRLDAAVDMTATQL
jgi:hypothetical protein